MNAHEGRADMDGPFLECPSSWPRRGLSLQSSGFSVQLPLGQSVAPMAEHWPVQLSPSPQVTLVRVVSRAQQPTLIGSFENVKEESKKLMSILVKLP